MGRPLSAEEVGTRLRARFGEGVTVTDVFGHAVVALGREDYRDAVRFLLDEPELAMDFVDFTCGVDLGTQGLEVVTHLFSTTHHHNVRVKVRLSAEDPVLDSIHDLFATWQQYRHGTLDRAGLQTAMHPVQDAFAALLDEGVRCPDAKAAGLCHALDRRWPALWNFVEEEGVEPTNNAAARAIRPAVLWRKGRFGTRSAAGARFVERLLTVTARGLPTGDCHQQGRAVLDYLTAVCTAAQLGQPLPSLLPTPA